LILGKKIKQIKTTRKTNGKGKDYEEAEVIFCGVWGIDVVSNLSISITIIITITVFEVHIYYF